MALLPEQEMIFPRFIDKPRMIGMFEIDEFFMAFGTMIFILFVSLAFPNVNSTVTMLVGFGVALGVAYGYRKFKKDKPEGFIIHFFYRKGILHPLDVNKAIFFKYPYLKNNRVVPYGFTKVLYN